jgi:predicted short-subunit dehydrogenase-like oxidoreductase (DUF2520 family)
MNISIIGSGNVAWHLAKALKASGNNLWQITGRNENTVNEIATLVAAEPNYSFQKINTNSDLLLLCVKDDAIEQLASLLPKTKGIVAHTSGFRSKNSLAACSENFGIFYPLQTMKKHVEISFETVPFLIEGNNTEVENELSTLAAQLSKSIHTVNELQRQYIHVAAVFANNFTNHLYELAENILSAQNLSLDLLRPLMAQSAANVQQFSPSKLQTGPAARKDFFTIEAHLKLLSSDIEMTKVYSIITESILRNKLV